MLIKSAIKTRAGYLYTGKRHSDIFIECKQMGIDRIGLIGCTQGFIDDSGRFWGRADAYNYAIACGQIKNNGLIGSVLTSEDLW
jgi:hypothetical protein